MLRQGLPKRSSVRHDEISPHDMEFTMSTASSIHGRRSMNSVGLPGY